MASRTIRSSQETMNIGCGSWQARWKLWMTCRVSRTRSGAKRSTSSTATTSLFPSIFTSSAKTRSNSSATSALGVSSVTLSGVRSAVCKGDSTFVAAKILARPTARPRKSAKGTASPEERAWRKWPWSQIAATASTNPIHTATTRRQSPRARHAALGLCLLVVAVWIGLVLAVAAIWLHGHFLHALSSGLAVPLALFLGLAVGLARILAATNVLSPLQTALLTPDKVTELTPRAEVADEFERVFALLVKIDGKRLVVAVDDVDRLAPERVLETLHVIHSFQRACQEPHPIFIVSCDERIVRDAIAEARPGLSARANDLEAAATAYLDRMFLQRQYVPPHPARDMRGFARDLLTAAPHTGAMHLAGKRDKGSEVVIHDREVEPGDAER